MSAVRRILRRPALALTTDWPAHWPEVLRRVHAARGSHSAQQALPALAGLLPFHDLKGIETAVAILQQAIASHAHIVVVGDFDCDGATACALGVRGLRMLGASHVSHAVPHRITHGYGLTPGLVEELTALRPDVVLTVDHGIACHAGVAAAKAQGWQVVVTDHHLPGETLPQADAIVNPNQPGDTFASKSLAGVGVMFYVLAALRAAMGVTADIASLLDLVAVGSVADMVPLDANNRALVGAGLRRLRAGKGCVGLAALAAVAGRNLATLTTADIGFSIGPRINAAGRLEDMGVGIACLLTDDAQQAHAIAATLHAINEERRALQADMQDTAEAKLDGQDTRFAVSVFDPQWHPGVVGLVASKLKECLHRPSVAFAPAEPDSPMLRGSARSIPGFHIRDALVHVDAQHPGLIARFGGHAMAAGLSLHHDALPRFREAFSRVAEAWLSEEALTDQLYSDGELSVDELTISTALALRDGGHWGQGYPEPLFDAHIEVVNWRVLKERHLKYEFVIAGRRFHGIQFNAWPGKTPEKHMHIAYRLVADTWRGGDAVQLMVVHAE